MDSPGCAGKQSGPRKGLPGPPNFGTERLEKLIPRQTDLAPRTSAESLTGLESLLTVPRDPTVLSS